MGPLAPTLKLVPETHDPVTAALHCRLEHLDCDAFVIDVAHKDTTEAALSERLAEL